MARMAPKRKRNQVSHSINRVYFSLTFLVEEEPSSNRGKKRARKPYVAPVVKTLTEDDVDKYSIFDVVMPLPGTDVAYPGGKLGDRYREFLKMDGLDANNFVRKQR